MCAWMLCLSRNIEQYLPLFVSIFKCLRWKAHSGERFQIDISKNQQLPLWGLGSFNLNETDIHINFNPRDCVNIPALVPGGPGPVSCLWCRIVRCQCLCLGPLSVAVLTSGPIYLPRPERRGEETIGTKIIVSLSGNCACLIWRYEARHNNGMIWHKSAASRGDETEMAAVRCKIYCGFFAHRH